MMGWLLAFLVHSTLWLGLTWLWTMMRPHMGTRVRETIWYTAIAASFITSTAHALVASDSAIWQVPLPAALVSAQESGHTKQEEAAVSGSLSPEHGGAEHRSPQVSEADAGYWPAGSAGSSMGWRGAAGWAWLFIVGVLMVCYFGRLHALRRRLEPHELVSDLRAGRALTQLSRQANIGRAPLLTLSDHLGSPIAIGSGGKAEVCVPARALDELDDEQLRAMLAHEVAHHMRRDPQRLGVMHMLKAVFFFQPLLRVAQRQLSSAAEQQCDDWAASQVDDRLTMASCLAEVAAWVLPIDRRLPVPCMARGRSQLRIRVDRLLQEQGMLEAPRWGRRVIGSAAMVVLACGLAPAVAPAGVNPGEKHDQTHRAEPEHLDDVQEHASRYTNYEQDGRLHVESADEHSESTGAPPGEHRTEQQHGRGHR